MDTARLVDADDAALVGRIVDGDVRAFEVLVRRYTRVMRVYARRLLGSDADVDDVVQEAFVAAWRSLDGLEDAGAVRGWLLRVVANRSRDRLRARHDATSLDDDELEAPSRAQPERVAEERSASSELRAALARLPDAQRRCWVMREAGGAGYDEIAQTLGLPVSTVRGMLARARRRVAAEMGEWR